jgi:hypothetical protein
MQNVLNYLQTTYNYQKESVIRVFRRNLDGWDYKIHRQVRYSSKGETYYQIIVVNEQPNGNVYKITSNDFENLPSFNENNLVSFPNFRNTALFKEIEAILIRDRTELKTYS